MAERRMFAKSIIDSDAFLEMPQSTQNLYFHLSMRADDEGFINNPLSIMKSTGCKQDDMGLLINKKYIIPFESGIIVIKHWRIHNYIQSDRFKATTHKNERALLELDENGYYLLPKPSEEVSCIHNVYKVDTQVSIGKVSIGKNSKDIGVFDAYSGDDIALKNALIEYEKMRNLKKWNMTDHSRKLLCRELDKLKAQGHDIIECLNTAILNNWKSVYAPKESKHKVEPIPEYESDTKNLSDEELEALKKRLKGMK